MEPVISRMCAVSNVRVSTTVTTAAPESTPYRLPGPACNKLATQSSLPSGETAAATGSRATATRVSSFRCSRSITDTSWSKRLQTYSRLPSGESAGAVAVWPAGRLAMTWPEAVSISSTELAAAAQAT